MDLKHIESIVREALGKIEHPVYQVTLEEMNAFDHVEEEDGQLKIVLKSPDEDRKAQIQIESQLRGILNKQGLPKGFKIRFILDESIKPEVPESKIRGVKHIVLIGSGKGGVGKSTVTVNLAVALRDSGYSVGVLDSDIYGPSIGKMFGFEGRVTLYGDGKHKIYPLEKYGIKIMSFSFLLDPGQPVIWRGPMLGKAVEEFLFEVDWGELDFLLIDLPPGTGDVQLSISQFVDVSGAIVVTTPQTVSLQDAKRALTMFQHVKIPVLGIIENMSEFICPHCGKTSYIFSRNGGQTFSAEYNVPLLGSIPLDITVMESGETGVPALLQKHIDRRIVDSYYGIADRVVEEIQKQKVSR